MKLVLSTPAKALNKAYLKKSLKREQIELFKSNLARLLDRVNEKESEEHLKNLVSDFLKDTWYRNDFEINTKDRTDHLPQDTGKVLPRATSLRWDVFISIFKFSTHCVLNYPGPIIAVC